MAGKQRGNQKARDLEMSHINKRHIGHLHGKDEMEDGRACRRLVDAMLYQTSHV